MDTKISEKSVIGLRSYREHLADIHHKRMNSVNLNSKTFR